MWSYNSVIHSIIGKAASAAPAAAAMLLLSIIQKPLPVMPVIYEGMMGWDDDWSSRGGKQSGFRPLGRRRVQCVVSFRPVIKDEDERQV